VFSLEVAVATLLHPVLRLAVGSDISRCETRSAPLGAGAASILLVLASRSARLANQMRMLAIDYLLYRFVLFVQQEFNPVRSLAGKAATSPDGEIDQCEYRTDHEPFPVPGYLVAVSISRSMPNFSGT